MIQPPPQAESLATGPADPPLADRIDALLPQTQCTKCGFDGCRPYAEAIADGVADINRCPPGGAANIVRLAALTGRPAKALDPACGIEAPRRVAWIDPQRCIGCTRCIPACPVDAIVGAPKFLHGILAAQCTGCELCLPPCPVDCIVMRPLDAPAPWTDAHARQARQRYDRTQRRRASSRRTGSASAPSSPPTPPPSPPQAAAAHRPSSSVPTGTTAIAQTMTTSTSTTASPDDRKRAMIAAATERARRNLSDRKPT